MVGTGGRAAGGFQWVLFVTVKVRNSCEERMKGAFTYGRNV